MLTYLTISNLILTIESLNSKYTNELILLSVLLKVHKLFNPFEQILSKTILTFFRFCRTKNFIFIFLLFLRNFYQRLRENNKEEAFPVFK